MSNELIIINRTASNRSYLAVMALEMAGEMSQTIIHKLLSKQPMSDLAFSVSQASRNILQKKHAYLKRRDLMEQVEKCAIEQYSNFTLVIPQKNTSVKERLEIYRNSIITRSETELLKACGFEIVDLRTSDIPPFIRIENLQTLSCFEYAFSRAGVEEAFKRPWSQENLLEHLDEWGFRSVEKENSRPGDLVLFLKQGSPVHMGIRYKNQILSKPGNGMRFAYVHRLEDAFECYGDQAIYLRRKILN